LTGDVANTIQVLRRSTLGTGEIYDMQSPESLRVKRLRNLNRIFANYFV
jgi:hypothetical protein